jgi:acetoin utilization protein AcuB
MLVKNWMINKVVCVTPDDTLQTALQVLDDHAFHRLPVVSGTRFEGSITRPDIECAAVKRCNRLHRTDVETFFRHTPVRDLMTPETIALATDQTIEEAAALIVQHDIHEAPVVNLKGDMVGIITWTDLLRALVSVTGAQTGGILLAFMMPDRRGMIKEVTDTIHEFGGRISSILTTETDAPEGMHKIYVRVTGIDRFRLNPLRQKLEEKVTLLYVIDRREVRKDISQRTPP